MREEAPGELIEMLSRLQLATADQVAEVYPQVQKLARNLPLFQSVWVDALLRAGRLTRFQAAEINAGRGNGLKNMRQRLEKIGGRCEIQSAPGAGTEIKFFVSVSAIARKTF